MGAKDGEDPVDVIRIVLNVSDAKCRRQSAKLQSAKRLAAGQLAPTWS